jgi:membrane protein
MSPRAFLERSLAWILERPPVAVLRLVLDVYGRAAGGLLANGLAFSALFAAVPSTLLVLGLVGWVAAGDAAVRQQVTDALVAALPPLADLIRDSVDSATDSAALASAVGVVGLIWTVSQLFGAIDVAFARIFSDTPERTGIRRTIRGLVVVAVLGMVLIAAIASFGVLAALDTVNGTGESLARDVAGLLAAPPMLTAIAVVAVTVGYRILPPEPPRWRAILLPAVLVGAGLVLLSQAFTFLVPRLVGAAELAGSLASGFVALAWLSFSFQAVLLGAAWVRVRDAGRPGRVTPSSSVGRVPLVGAATPAEPGVG